ncbi:OLC1v1016559C1 [Oldenlandia corymbosa var. corymbosa]|uniref:OLC1v1016559C1 n=1 Tax=Oldenlandia corymbosa var. corymbosa TaxID=529605 RepID=A0AAV1E5W6_OLDCO|nr:OLC1v1016559C1 [Oldenlandia corymbosa var. corymbosa]
MGSEVLETITKMRKLLKSATVRCYRSVSCHPFLVGVLFFLVFLYRSSPFVFSLLVSAFPVLISTAVLLGTLLSFGQPNIPEIDIDEKNTHSIDTLKTGVSGDTVVTRNNEIYTVEKFNESTGGLVEQLNGVAVSIASRSIELHRADSIDSNVPLVEEFPRGSEPNDEVVAEATKNHVSGWTQKTDVNNERLGDEGDARTDDEDLNDRSPAESFDSEMVNVDSLDSPPDSPWKHMKEEYQEEEDAEDDEDMDSGSDRAESSSPDASMADIMPMLDELHPLLDEDTPHPAPLSHDGSDAASEGSLESTDSSSDSDDNLGKDELLEVADEDIEDADDEDEGQGPLEGETKSAITWTEEDQKNLMDLGTSELERNQRLESLIARRRARKTMNIMAERNLIDLDSAELPFSIAPISTARNNPFDLPHDSYDDMGLPPIPGSAPSILLARRNPFDLPYDSSEEKPDLLGDNFHQEFTGAPPREPFFRRHESFNIGPSFFAPSRQQDGRLRPYFVAEKMDSEGIGYSSFQRQSSGLSDSKASSLPESESAASAGDNEEKHRFEGNSPLLDEPLNSFPEVELRETAGDLNYGNASEEDIDHELNTISMKDDTGSNPVDIPQEQELISDIEHVSEHVGHGSQTSEEADSLELGEFEKRDVESNEEETESHRLECDNGAEAPLFMEAEISGSMNVTVTETNLNDEATKQDILTSSSSPLSELSERIFPVREGEELSCLEETRDHAVQDASIVADLSLEESNYSISSESSQKEPIYDSSPTANKNKLSLSSLSPDLQDEMETEPILIKTAVTSEEGESGSCGQDIKGNTSGDVDGSGLVFHTIDANQSGFMSMESSDNNIARFSNSGDDRVSNSEIRTVVADDMISDMHDKREIQPMLIKTTASAEAELGSCGQEMEGNSSGELDGSRLILHSIDATQSGSMSMESSDSTTARFTSSGADEVSNSQSEKLAADAMSSDLHDEMEFQPIQEEKHIPVQDKSASEESSVAEKGEDLVFLDKSG